VGELFQSWHDVGVGVGKRTVDIVRFCERGVVAKCDGENRYGTAPFCPAVIHVSHIAKLRNSNIGALFERLFAVIPNCWDNSYIAVMQNKIRWEVRCSALGLTSIHPRTR
jgi:hypothetical protein